MAAAATATALQQHKLVVGQPLPDAPIAVLQNVDAPLGARIMSTVHAQLDLTKGGVLITVPDAFTGTCHKHLKSYIADVDNFDQVLCVATTNANANEAWKLQLMANVQQERAKLQAQAQAQATTSQKVVKMISDPQRKFGAAAGLLNDVDPNPTLGGANYLVLKRSLITFGPQGRVLSVTIVPAGEFEACAAEAALKKKDALESKASAQSKTGDAPSKTAAPAPQVANAKK